MGKFELWGGKDDEVFVITAGQLRDLAVGHALYGQRDFEAERYEDVEYGDGRCDVCANEYYRLRRLHDVTAGHLAKARAKLYCLRLDKEYAQAELRLWRGSERRGHETPDHYAGDGLVTCARAMESASAQPSVRRRTEDEGWWWRCAFKYVWRMWSKDDPVRDANKAIDSLERMVELIEAEEGADER